MSEIDFGDTQGEQLATLMRVVRDLHRDFYGNGQLGLKFRAESFMSEMKGVHAEQERQHQQNSAKLNWLLVICAVGTLLIGLFGVIYAVIHHQDIGHARIFRSQSADPAYAWSRPIERAGP